jgi:hypothetical protein
MPSIEDKTQGNLQVTGGMAIGADHVRPGLALEVHGAALTHKRIRYVPLLAQTINADLSEAHNASIAADLSWAYAGAIFDGEFIWIGASTTSLRKIDIRTNTVVATLTLPQQVLNVFFDGMDIWVTHGASGYSRINHETHVIKPLVATPAWGVASDGTYMWASIPSSGVNKIDPATDAIVNTVATGSSPQHLTFDGTHIWLCAGTVSAIYKIDVVSDTIVATVTTFSNAPIFDGTHIWSGSLDAGTVKKVDVDSASVVASVTGLSWTSVGCFDGNYLWMPTADSIVQIDIDSATVVNTIATAGYPGALVFDGTHIWYGCQGDGDIYKILVRRN